ncbi:TIGR03667 family PPOX class F420-dependent oxidoreductase [Actinomadura harenae]|uniref:TIGR03667 family PPOX class F420-dependent oxidoreductase n=1 Tax=Actinomadura harenae TaxID=2483351 RepID=A0A3M2LJX4_9ACTN|nr:TIGR03667 family PPOX class F420-dependent oxidoreductase [Actinomadura harenae]RMI37090.1 TIGR03667 family PPOX class F420-dependent oxidoreductase [Actinomadura harenae]
MELTAHLPAEARERAENRLRTNPIAWLTTVRPDGQPVSVPVWFLFRDDETILIYSEPGKGKLRNIAKNPKISLALDETERGRNVVRLEGTAETPAGHASADGVAGYRTKYADLIETVFGSPERFASKFSEAIVVTPRRLHA